jgi:hypothetical protein
VVKAYCRSLRSNTTLPIKGVKPDSDKHSRASYATPMIEGGQFRLLEGAAWSSDYLAEMTSFPGGHDDFVDATVQALTYLRDSPESNVLVYYRGPVEADLTQRQKVREQWPGISDSELRRHSLAAAFCQLCGENLLRKKSIRDGRGHLCIDCAQKNGMTF